MRMGATGRRTQKRRRDCLAFLTAPGLPTMVGFSVQSSSFSFFPPAPYS